MALDIAIRFVNPLFFTGIIHPPFKVIVSQLATTCNNNKNMIYYK